MEDKTYRCMVVLRIEASDEESAKDIFNERLSEGDYNDIDVSIEEV